MHLLNLDAAEDDVVSYGGGKTTNLYRLSRCGLDVPRWAAVGTDAFRHYLQVTGIDAKVRGLTASMSNADLEVLAREVAQEIESAEVDPRVRVMIEAAYREVGAGAVAVRSSGAEEDQEVRSFAGQFASYLNVTSLDEAVLCVRRCWASAFSVGALAYRRGHELSAANIDIAVIVQTMVPAESSGVLFTANPVTNATDEALISAVYGMGEGLVSGAVDADTIVVDRSTRRILKTTIGGKETRLDPHDDRPGCASVVVSEANRGKLALSEAEINEIAELGERISTALGGEQDIEWAYSGGRLWVLQSRPITTIPNGSAPSTRESAIANAIPEVWDNSSASENFGDVTTPLTFSFVQHVTHEIYREHFRRLWVPYPELHQMDGWLRAMFGYFNGRMYNNLTNWVRTNRLLPFARLRRSVMHTAMGLTGPIDQAIVDAAIPFSSKSKPRARAIRVVITARFVWRFATVGVSVRRFLKRFYGEYAALDVDYAEWSSDEIYRRLRYIEQQLVREFGSVLFLHPAISLAVGALERLTRRWLPDAPGWFHYQAASPTGGVASVEPAERLIALTALVRANPVAEMVVLNTPPSSARARLVDHGARGIVQAIDTYISEFGYRSINELKLEEPCLGERPADFFVMLADNLRSGGITRDATSGADGSDVDAYLKKHLARRRRLPYALVRWNARRFLRARERVRFCRTRAFGVVRTMFLAIGRDLARVGAIETERDIFYLRLEEIRGCFEGGIYPSELKLLVAARRDAETRYRQLQIPRRFETSGPVYWHNAVDETAWRAPGATSVAGAPVRELTGLPCCPGIVEGEARLMDAPGDAQGGIVATYRTDPGWATVLPSAAALLVEVGSPLNHVAIVARELGVPTIVQIAGLTATVRSGMQVRVDGGTGTLAISHADKNGDS
jgi:pyruvate,water dikinase